MLTSLLATAQFNPPDYNPNMWVTNGAVSAIVRSGNTIYLGGDFTYVGPKTGSGVQLSSSTGQVQGTPLPVNRTVYASIPYGSGG